MLRKFVVASAAALCLVGVALAPAVASSTDMVIRSVADGVPQDVTATVDQAARTVFLDWADVTGVGKYKVYEKASPAGVANGEPAVSESRRGPLAGDTCYEYWVTSFVDGVESAASAHVFAKVGNPAAACGGTTPSPPPGNPPVGGTVVYLGDYNTGNHSQYSSCQWKGFNTSCSSYGNDQYYSQVRNDGTGHETAARLEVRDGDVPPFGGGERAEVRAPSGASVTEGDERWYEFSMKFDADFPNPTGGWFIAMQWHAGSGSPPLALNVNRDGTWKIGGDGVSSTYHRSLGPIQRGQWVNYVLHVKFSRNASVGFAEMYANGALIVAKHNRPTMSSSSNYFKEGIYRDAAITSTAVLWHDGLRVTAP